MKPYPGMRWRGPRKPRPCREFVIGRRRSRWGWPFGLIEPCGKQGLYWPGSGAHFVCQEHWRAIKRARAQKVREAFSDFIEATNTPSIRDPRKLRRAVRKALP